MIWVNDHRIIEEYFPDGTPKMLNLPEMEPYPQDTIVWKFESITEQILLYNLVNHMRDHGANYIVLILPYIPNARMDRVKADTECFTLKYFAKFINDLHFSYVAVLDPHSDVAPALLDRVIVLDPSELIKSVLAEHNADIICFPDAGAYKRYSTLFSEMYDDGINLIPRIYCDKVRDWKTGKLLGMCVNHNLDISLEGKRVLIVDDLCSRGGTFMMCANELKKLGVADIQLWVSHCENSIFAGKVLAEDSPISAVWTTDSLKHGEHKKLFTFDFEVEEN